MFTLIGKLTVAALVTSFLYEIYRENQRQLESLNSIGLNLTQLRTQAVNN